MLLSSGSRQCYRYIHAVSTLYFLFCSPFMSLTSLYSSGARYHDLLIRGTSSQINLSRANHLILRQAAGVFNAPFCAGDSVACAGGRSFRGSIPTMLSSPHGAESESDAAGRYVKHSIFRESSLFARSYGFQRCDFSQRHSAHGYHPLARSPRASQSSPR